MRRISSFGVLMLTLSLATPAFSQGRRGPPLTLSTTAFADGGQIPVRFSQAADGAAPGEGTSPPLRWVNVPDGTQSFLLHMHDMEAARNRTTTDQVHWLVWNIPGSSSGLPEGVPRGSRLADGSYQISATGPVYRGPGAPANRPPHHYVFELFALDTALSVEPSEDPFETRERVMAAVQGHVLGKAVYMGFFRRPQ